MVSGTLVAVKVGPNVEGINDPISDEKNRAEIFRDYHRVHSAVCSCGEFANWVGVETGIKWVGLKNLKFLACGGLVLN